MLIKIVSDVDLYPPVVGDFFQVGVRWRNYELGNETIVCLVRLLR